MNSFKSESLSGNSDVPVKSTTHHDDYNLYNLLSIHDHHLLAKNLHPNFKTTLTFTNCVKNNDTIKDSLQLELISIINSTCCQRLSASASAYSSSSSSPSSSSSSSFSTVMCHPGSHCLNGELVGLRYHFLLGASPDCLYPFMDFMLPLPLIAVQNLSMQEIIKTFELIEEFGGNLKIKDSETGRSVLLEAANKLARRDEEYAAEFPSFLNWLVKSKRFRINEIDIEEGCSILHFVAFTQHEHLLVAILKKCLELGADPQFEDHEGLNALVYLAKFQSLETLITVMEQIPEFRKQEVLIRAISKTPWTSKQRSYLKEWKKAVLNS